MPARTVLENVMLGIESNTAGVLRSRELRHRFDELNERTGFRLEAQAVVRTLRTADQQKVEILRAIARDARLLLMDEPTAALTRDETERLLETVRSARRVRNGGRARLALPRGGSRHLRHGHVDAERPADPDRAGEGRDTRDARLGDDRPRDEPRVPAEDPSARTMRRWCSRRVGCSRGRELQDVSLTGRAGEIVGLAGLVGSGRTEVARAIFGADHLDAGELLFEGKPVRGEGPPSGRRGSGSRCFPRAVRSRASS